MRRRVYPVTMKQFVTALLIAGFASIGSAGPERPIDVGKLAFTPGIDGDLREWEALEPYRIAIEPAVEDDERNRTGSIEVELWIGRGETDIFVAARWADATADTEFRPWRWRGNKYRRSKKRDDMFAMRFAFGGDYNRSMIADADYAVDVWVWSAGRSNHAGVATDYRHRISTSMIENAPEYETDSGKTVYIDRIRDAGDRGYRTIKPGKNKTANRVASIEPGAAAGSVADVAAAGRWRDGRWMLELRRALDTGHDDDVRFFTGQEILGQIAVFNRSGGEHKSVSEPLLFRID